MGNMTYNGNKEKSLIKIIHSFGWEAIIPHSEYPLRISPTMLSGTIGREKLNVAASSDKLL